jgi:GGDEF domain-containing protein
MDADEEIHDYDLGEVQKMAAQGRRLAIYDRATGLYAYWYLELRATEELARSLRHQRQAFVLSLWAATPGAQEALTSRLKDGLRETDIAAYLNNGHFAVLLTETNGRGALTVLARLLADMGTEVSCGMAQHPSDGETFDELLERAKGRGRSEGSAHAA